MKYLQNQRLHHPLIKRKLVNNVISLTENWQACVYHSEVQCSIYLQVVHVECQSRNVTFYYTTVNMSLYQILAHVLKTALGVERRRTNLKTGVTISKSAECNIIYSSGTGTRHEPLPDSLPVCIQQQQVSKDKPCWCLPLSSCILIRYKYTNEQYSRTIKIINLPRLSRSLLSLIGS